MSSSDSSSDLLSAFQGLLQHVQTLQQLLQAPAASPQTLREQVQALQKFVQFQIIPLKPQGLPLSSRSRLQAIQTELSKQIRLINMGVLFLQTARQPETWQKRIGQLDDRLAQVQTYCQVILEGF
jgi:hypothetical protein